MLARIRSKKPKGLQTRALVRKKNICKVGVIEVIIKEIILTKRKLDIECQE